MPHFSDTSLERLETCDRRLQILFKRVIQDHDCTIVEGHRGEQTQNDLYMQQKSHLRFPDSKHNTKPSRAVDVAPYNADLGKIPWENRRAFDHFAGYVMGIAKCLGMKIRWGGDWNMNGYPGDKSKFHDLPHFELMEE